MGRLQAAFGCRCPHESLGAIQDAAELGALFAACEPFDVVFRRCARFPGVLYLVPEPGAPFRALTGIVAARWPERNEPWSSYPFRPRHARASASWVASSASCSEPSMR
ncbi:2'-5' RNA ligase family protein [Nonomuraea sp. LPB2021202275-12-8]|uniref:2'-5' RNA ligase family protein n=1 Tax=Nonomuraea sp. LPB2021202275-12-8 TaxID=3120159 RepID=UPI003FA57F87